MVKPHIISSWWAVPISSTWNNCAFESLVQNIHYGRSYMTHLKHMWLVFRASHLNQKKLVIIAFDRNGLANITLKEMWTGDAHNSKFTLNTTFFRISWRLDTSFVHPEMCLTAEDDFQRELKLSEQLSVVYGCPCKFGKTVYRDDNLLDRCSSDKIDRKRDTLCQITSLDFFLHVRY